MPYRFWQRTTPEEKALKMIEDFFVPGLKKIKRQTRYDSESTITTTRQVNLLQHLRRHPTLTTFITVTILDVLYNRFERGKLNENPNGYPFISLLQLLSDLYTHEFNCAVTQTQITRIARMLLWQEVALSKSQLFYSRILLILNKIGDSSVIPTIEEWWEIHVASNSAFQAQSQCKQNKTPGLYNCSERYIKRILASLQSRPPLKN